jgi:polyisoprenoid-binding protein YceI
MATRTKVLIGALVVAVLAVSGGLYWFLARDEPPEASIENALAGRTTTTSPRSGATTDAAPRATSVEGTWTVDTTTGGFDFESATGTFAGFRIQENLAGIGATHAVGRTGDVSGSMTIGGTSVTAAGFEVDLTSITSNDSRRNSRIQEALETDRFPTAAFRLTSPIDLGADVTSGREVSVTATGDLTIHGTTRSVRFPLRAKLSGDTIAVAGSLDVDFADYGVRVPHSQIVVSVEDHGPIELQLLLTRSGGA